MYVYLLASPFSDVLELVDHGQDLLRLLEAVLYDILDLSGNFVVHPHQGNRLKCLLRLHVYQGTKLRLHFHKRIGCIDNILYRRTQHLTDLFKTRLIEEKRTVLLFLGIHDHLKFQ